MVAAPASASSLTASRTCTAPRGGGPGSPAAPAAARTRAHAHTFEHDATAAAAVRRERPRHLVEALLDVRDGVHRKLNRVDGLVRQPLNSACARACVSVSVCVHSKITHDKARNAGGRVCARTEWKSLPVHFMCHVRAPAVPMQGCESAESTQITGPPRMWESRPAAMSPSTPTPGCIQQHASNTHTQSAARVSERRQWLNGGRQRQGTCGNRSCKGTALQSPLLAPPH